MELPNIKTKNNIVQKHIYHATQAKIFRHQGKSAWIVRNPNDPDGFNRAEADFVVVRSPQFVIDQDVIEQEGLRSAHAFISGQVWLPQDFHWAKEMFLEGSKGLDSILQVRYNPKDPKCSESFVCCANDCDPNTLYPTPPTAALLFYNEEGKEVVYAVW